MTYLARLARLGSLCLLAAFGLPSAPALTPAARAAEQRPALTLTLAPAQADEGRAIETVAVTLRFDGLAIPAGDVVLALPHVINNVDTVATVLSDLTARDGAGPLALDVRDADRPDGNFPVREWVTPRATQGPIVVRYTVTAEATLPPRGPAPPYSFTHQGGGVSASGHMFVLLPPQAGPYHATVDWDLSGLPAESRAVSSLGEGAVSAAGPMSGGELRRTFFMAGDIETWPEDVPASGFFGAIQGDPPFDGLELLAWSGRLYERYAEFFSQQDAPPYGVFLRHNPINAGGGVGLHRSFVTTFDEDSTPAGLKSTLAHEMFHTFQPRLQEPGGLASSWFGEGLAVFYQSRLPLRFGQIGPDDFLEDLNSHAARYYTSAMARLPNDEIAAGFWADTRIRTLPYDRGMLYFVTVDQAVRSASDGARSLDDLMLEMLSIQQSGRTTSPAVWESVLEAELGEEAVEAFRAFLDGAMPVPASDAFGPCFARTTRMLRRYELGFEPSVLAEPVRIVRGLKAGSNAARAGLLDGDEIVRPVPQDSIQGDQDAPLTLLVRRGDEEFPVTYLPRGEAVEAYQWERVEGVPDSACGL